MRASFWGVFLAGSVIYFGVIKGSSHPAVFLNAHALILVIGGTVAVSLMAYSFQKLQDVFDFIVFGFLFKTNKSFASTVEELTVGAHDYNINREQMNFERIKHPFVKEAFRMLVKPELSHEQVEVILKSRRNSFKKKYMDDSKVLTAISKFPPALGLLGASTGMIEMMANLGAAGDSSSIGSAMAVALTGTFWGIGLANLLILPLADYATNVASEDIYMRDTIIESVMMLKKDYPVTVVVEHSICRLPIFERVRLKNKMPELIQSLEPVPFAHQIHGGKSINAAS